MTRFIGATASILTLAACAANHRDAVPREPPPPSHTMAPKPATVVGREHVREHVGREHATKNVAPVTVALIVDQLAAWIALERLPLLPKSGGFARLTREGTWYQDMRFAHAITDTAPGHASLYSGVTPREHGVVANEFLDGGHGASVMLDRGTHLVDAAGQRSEPGSSASRLQVPVVADRFKAAVPNGRVYSFSLKDRGAIPGGGQHPDLTMWFDPGLGEFVSSTAFVERLPTWAASRVSNSAISARTEQSWTLLDPSWKQHALAGDDQTGEGNLAEYGTVFPHRAKDSTKPFSAYRANPDSDRLLLELGVAAIESTPQDLPILLAISLSANDYIGHIFGPDSWEAWDELLRLDSSLAWFFAELDRRKGPTQWSAALSADHGVAPLPELSRPGLKPAAEAATDRGRPQLATHRVIPGELDKTARAVAKKAVGEGDWIASFVEPYLTLTDAARQLPTAKQPRLRKQLIDAMSALPCIERLYDVAAQSTTCPPNSDESTDALRCRSMRPGMGGDYFVALQPGCFFDTGYVLGAGTSHGSPALYDRSVPLLVRAPDRQGTGKVVSTPVSFSEFSSQLVALLGIR